MHIAQGPETNNFSTCVFSIYIYIFIYIHTVDEIFLFVSSPCGEMGPGCVSGKPPRATPIDEKFA